MSSYKYKNLNVDCYPTTVPSNKTIILLIGLPGKPKTYDAISKFNDLGFNVILPHYEGTWSSDGGFLKRSPSQSINELIENYDSDNIYIIGSSFGGWVAWGLNDHQKIKKVCLVSPVISFKKVHGIETLCDYIREVFPKDYRFDDHDWEILLNDNIQNPASKISINPEKILILAGKNDDQINYSDIVEFAMDQDISNIIIEECGHITPNKINDGQISRIAEFFNG
jgi:esterase/lipase